MLAAALRAGAAGLYWAEAGAELLTGQQSWLCRSDFTGSFITLTPGLPGQATVAGQGCPARRRAPGRHGHLAAGHPASPAEKGV